MSNRRADPLDEYRRKRDPGRTPEPVPPGPTKDPAREASRGDPEPSPPTGNNDTFVIQQHHARRLHWDLRLERDGVLVSWAVPRGVPHDPGRNHLAVHTEDHPLEYADFHGEIPAGEYGGGRMTIHDRGTYTTEKWRDDEVIVVLHGSRTRGRYVLFQTSGKDWMIHRMDPPEPGWSPMPAEMAPMRPVESDALPADDESFGYELAWDGVRAIGFVSGGRLRLVGHGDITAGYPELRPLAEALAPTECVLDGVIVAFDRDGRVSRSALRPRTGVTGSTAARRLASRTPVQYLVVDVLWLDGQSTVDMPYRRRRELLDRLAVAGQNWQTPPYFEGGGTDALATAQAQRLPGVIAKRLGSPYRPGERSADWLAVPQPAECAEVVVVGWKPGRRSDVTLLLAVRDGTRLRYAGQVSAPGELASRLRALARQSPPVDGVPAADVHWVSPKLIGTVTHDGYTRGGRLRRPHWQSAT